MNKSAVEIAIRTRRAAFNRAIAEGDVAAIQPLLGRDVVMMTGSDSAIVSGRNAQIKVWRREFASPARAVYTRTPTSVAVSRVEPVALETGHWQGVEARSGKALASGDYSAKWREVLGEWVIVAEIYATLG
ncbi:YybH family protein [Novosphingobium mangrovi (ex Huang et al. 2023)]|uniref:Nuclear transport factor 2 family protein n=1 Tax=Novosphingobium mangrovi (ex Huang et al. 2023) TaxID=2976432 RepID=A0ABT2I029_9SPHN|nr:nuclear transport factor 2 family protein [Novosphingobium mangrovi (ex Huang et al. 2023)]MCT2398038.1 nuclear transport factor 2 family protein [Novosphingobium mangrovi (ex Huang et al. 2023)]